MTKIEELEQKLNEWFKTVSKEEMIKILKEEGFEVIDKESKKEGKWKPKKGECYWFRNEFGVIQWYRTEEQGIIDWQYNNIPLFLTKEACERYWHFMDTVKEKSYEFSKEEWENVDIPKFVIKHNYEKDYFEIGCFQSIKYFNTTYFKTEEDAKYIIDNFKDELMEYWI